MRKYIDSEIKDDVKEINKTFRPIWEFTYKIVGADETRVKLVNRDPDKLLVSWVP
jgi:flagellar hook-associated protein FlgK